MKYEVLYTARAKKDLQDIFRYISEELFVLDSAVGQTKRIINEIQKLDTLPNRNRLYEKEPWHSKGIRFLPVNKYLIFYKTDIETEMVYIIRIIYSGRDVHKQLSQTEEF